VSRPESTLPTTRALGWWGMLLLIATEATLFAVLIASYFYLRFQIGPAWPPDGIEPPELLAPSFSTAILVASSLPIALAAAGLRRGRFETLTGNLLAAFLLGALFLGLQAHSWNESLDVVTPQTNAYGSLFYTLSGVHTAHVVVGVLLVGWILVRAWRGAYRSERHVEIDAVALYVHFVNATSIAVYATIYLFPHF
jgi:heme/copper-type cytochrome/quinol oxidase subunit 3